VPARPRLIDPGWWAAALLGAAVMAWLGLTGFVWTDYENEAAPALRALAAGDVGGFLERVPAYGGSLVLRAPVAGATALLGGGELAIFRALAIPCLLAAAVLGMALVGRLRDRGVERGTRALVLGLCVANPVTLRALEIGHPEELLAAVLAIGAVLAACGRRDVAAGLLLGLAIGTKLWAVLAIGPVLLALPDRRLRTLALAGGAAAAVFAPIVLAGQPTTVITGAGHTGTIFTPWQVFWALGHLGEPVIGTDGLVKPGYRTPPGWLAPLTHPAIALSVIPASLLWLRRRGQATLAEPEQVLLLLAVLLLGRCVLDPWNSVYYGLPFLLALLAWESLCRSDRPPVLTVAATALTWASFEWVPQWVGPDAQCALYLAWTLPLGAWLAHAAFARPGVRAGGRAGAAFLRAPRRAGARVGEIRVRPGAHVG
jgi:hypothetical protein